MEYNDEESLIDYIWEEQSIGVSDFDNYVRLAYIRRRLAELYSYDVDSYIRRSDMIPADIIDEVIKAAKDDDYPVKLKEKLLSQYTEEELKINRCPKCNKIARTARAKQCRYCEYDWH